MFHVEARGEHVSVLRMDDGKVNAIGPDFVQAFPKAWADATRDGRAVVLAGNAKAFCAGLDLKTLPTLNPDQLLEFFRAFMRVTCDVYAYDRPVVAAVGGPAMAGGAILALAADFRIASARARIGLTELPVGIPFPPPILTLASNELPAHEIGPAIMMGWVRDGESALERGWVHHIAPHETILDDAVEHAAQMAQFNPRAYGPAKRQLRAGTLAQMDAFTSGTKLQAYVETLTHPDTMEAVVRYFQRVAGKK